MNEHDKDAAAADPSGEAAINQLVRKGVLSAPRQTFDEEFWNLPRPEDPQGKALADLIAERRER